MPPKRTVSVNIESSVVEAPVAKPKAKPRVKKSVEVEPIKEESKVEPKVVPVAFPKAETTKPPRKVSAYSLFVKDQYESVRHLAGKERLSALAKQWHDLKK